MKTKTYEELRFTDDFLFCKILMENEDLCIELAELVTGRKISSLVYKADQKAVKVTPDGKGVRFDVYFEDDQGGRVSICCWKKNSERCIRMARKKA